MQNYEKEYGKYVVFFQSENDYIESGFGLPCPNFAGIVIREKFSNKAVELQVDLIKFFLKELKKLNNKKKSSFVKLIHKWGWEKYSSDFVIAISDYDGIRCKFFTEISHQFNGIFDSIETCSPEFQITVIIQILEDANKEIKNG